MDRESIEDVSSKQRAQDFGSMDQPICREAAVVKPRNLDGSKIYRDSIEVEERKLDGNGIYRGSIEKLSSLKKRSF